MAAARRMDAAEAFHRERLLLTRRLFDELPLAFVRRRYKNRAATIWCENATLPTGTTWSYLKVMQKEYVKLQPSEFSEAAVAFAATAG